MDQKDNSGKHTSFTFFTWIKSWEWRELHAQSLEIFFLLTQAQTYVSDFIQTAFNFKNDGKAHLPKRMHLLLSIWICCYWRVCEREFVSQLLLFGRLFFLRNAQVQMQQRFYPNKTIFCVHLCLRNTIDFFSLTFETSKIQIFNRTKREIQQHIHENLPLKQKTTTMTTHTHAHTHPFDVFTLNFLEKTLSKHWDLVYFVYRHMKSPLLILLTQWWHFRMVYKHTP